MIHFVFVIIQKFCLSGYTYLVSVMLSNEKRPIWQQMDNSQKAQWLEPMGKQV